jgi:hypothetical protein
MVKSAHLKCGRSWIQGPVSLNKDYETGICCSSSELASLRSTIRAKNGWLGIRIMCPRGTTTNSIEEK